MIEKGDNKSGAVNEGHRYFNTAARVATQLYSCNDTFLTRCQRACMIKKGEVNPAPITKDINWPVAFWNQGEIDRSHIK